jgi:hypothetical protein
MAAGNQANELNGHDAGFQRFTEVFNDTAS